MATVSLSSAFSSPAAASLLADYTTFGYVTLDKAFYAGGDGGGVRPVGLVSTSVPSTVVSSAGSGGGTGTQYFRVRGWYAAGSTFEVWVSTNPYSAPPSGHTLVDVSFVPFDVGA